MKNDKIGVILLKITLKTGSPAQHLIDWYMYRNGDTKPLDFEIFVNLMNELKVKV